MVQSISIEKAARWSVHIIFIFRLCMDLIWCFFVTFVGVNGSKRLTTFLDISFNLLKAIGTFFRSLTTLPVYIICRSIRPLFHFEIRKGDWSYLFMNGDWSYLFMKGDFNFYL